MNTNQEPSSALALAAGSPPLIKLLDSIQVELRLRGLGPAGDVLALAVTTIESAQASHDKLCAVTAALKHLVEVIDAHEIESLSCDRAGSECCDCLRNAATEAKRLLPNTTVSNSGH